MLAQIYETVLDQAEGPSLGVRRVPTISSQMLDDDGAKSFIESAAADRDRPKLPSLNIVSESEEEVYCKIKEDSELQDRSMFQTNQS